MKKKDKTEGDKQEIGKWRGFLAKGQPLFVGRQGPLDNQAISGIISELIEKSGLNENNGFKPTSLRDALEDALVEANISHKIKEALMGHVSDIEHEYGSQNKLVINIVEAMRKAYPLLSLNGLTRVSTEQQVSKEEFEAMKQKLAEMEEWRKIIEKTISERELIELQWKRTHLEYEQEQEEKKTEK